MKERLVTTNIVETLERSGAMKFKELYKIIHRIHSDVEEHSFEETLMVMELQGLISVFTITKGKRRIELTGR